MTGPDADRLTLAVKINRLFAVCRAKGESEQSMAAVARAVGQIIGRPVTIAEVALLRVHSDEGAANDVVLGLARHFGVPVEYLTMTGPRVEAIDKQLQLLAAARDAGVKMLALRNLMVADAGAADSVLGVLRSIQPSPSADFRVPSPSPSPEEGAAPT